MTDKRWLGRAARRVPYLRNLVHQRDDLRGQLDEVRTRLNETQHEIDRLSKELEELPGEARTWVPPGHFYSPLPAIEEVRRDEARIFGDRGCLPGVDMRDADQVALMEELAAYYPQIPFPETQDGVHRYFYENGAYSYADAIFLHCLIRHLQPKRIIEVGSGHSSCVTLDTNDLFCGGSIRLTFIEPYPELLYGLLREGERESIDVIPTRLQDVDAALFEELGENDILFIDSTHVAKTGSDVNFNFFDILPRLKPGVYVHIHDIFYPFEYPDYWVYEGRAWNEAYLLHAFLQYNDTYQVVAHTDYLAKRHGDRLAEFMPLAMKNPGGSIWLKRVK